MKQWTQVHELEGHCSRVIALVVFKRKLYSASVDGFIAEWDLMTLRKIRCFKAHNRGVLCIQAIEHADYPLLFSTSSDNTIKIWNLENHHCLATITGHPGDIFSMSLSKTLIFVGCQDTTVKIIDYDHILETVNNSGEGKEGGEIIDIKDTYAVTLKSHTGLVYSLFVKDYTVISSSGDGTILIWDEIEKHISPFENREKVNLRSSITGSRYVPFQESMMIPLENKSILSSDTGAVYDVIADDFFIYSCHQDGTIKIWDIETRFLRRTLTGHSVEVLSIVQTKNFLISSSADQTIKVWEKATFRCIQTINEESKPDSFMSLASTANDSVFFSTNENRIFIWSNITGEDDLDNGRSVQVEEEEYEKPVKVCSVVNIPAVLKIQKTKKKTQTVIEMMSDPLVLSLRSFISLKTISGDERFIDECWKGAQFLRKLLEFYGFQVQLIREIPTKNPLVFARLGYDKSKPTVTFYGHYDVFPVSKNDWKTNPFTMVGKNGYLYGRGTSDDKGPILTVLFAAVELLNTGNLPVNLVFIIEGEEERSSEGFKESFQKNLKWFEGTDLVLFSNTVWLGESKPCIHYGLRGVLDVTLTISGPKRNLHSGVDGGVINEPMMDLMSILSSIVDNKGKVMIDSFYDEVRPITEEEEALYVGLDFSPEEYRDSIGVSRLLSNHSKELLMNRWRHPTLSIHSISNHGAKGTVIPAAVTCNVTMRLVPDQSIAKTFALFSDYVKKRFGLLNSGNELTINLNKSGDWWIGDIKNKYFKALEESLEEVWKSKPNYTREGGTIPLTSYIENSLHAPAIHFPLGQSSDSAHLNDERIRLENLILGKKALKNFFVKIGES